jgi:hypothetical protein
MKSRLSKFIALALIQCQLSVMLPAEELRTDLRRGMARLEHYLDRAQAERNTQSWEQLARFGLEAAMYEWESGALWLREQDVEVWQAERERAETDYRRETEAAYVAWASGRVYTERAVFEGSGLGAELRKAAASWSYGDAGRVVNLADAEGARAAWELVAQGIVDRYLDSWEEQQGTVFAELESYFRDAGLSAGEREALIREAAEGRRVEVGREYRRIALAEGNRLMSELLYDRGSLKKLAADEAAGLIARELAREAEAAADERARELFDHLDTMFAAGEVEDIEITANEWLDQFRRVFEEGLAQWEEAELSFLAARIEWEHDAEDAYLAGEEAWNRAYLELSERQKAWETAILRKLDEGLAQWQDSGSRLAAEIEAARGDFITASEESRRIKEKMLDSQIEIYVRSRRTMELVRQGIESWYGLWNEKYLMVYVAAKNAAGLPDRFKELDPDVFKYFLEHNDIDELTNPLKNNAEILRKQIQLWKDAYLELVKQELIPPGGTALLESAGLLIDEDTGWLSLAIKYRSYADTAGERLYALAGNTGDSIEGYNNELETELLKAKALLDYWDDELEVAEALSQYAQETSSVIEMAEETREELERAKAAYDEAVQEYRAISEVITEKGLILEKAQDDFEQAQYVLVDLKAAVEEAQKNYFDIIAALNDVSPAPVYAELAALADRMMDIWQKDSMGTTILSYYRLAFEYADILRTMEIDSLIQSLEAGAASGDEGLLLEESIVYLKTGVLPDSPDRAAQILARYGSYHAEEQNRRNGEARQRVAELITAVMDGSRDTGGYDRALEYAAELREESQDLNAPGMEALNAYIITFLEYAAVRDSLDNLENPLSAVLLLDEYWRTEESYNIYSQWQRLIFDAEGQAEIRGSSEFSCLEEADRETFLFYAGYGDISALSVWYEDLMRITLSDLWSKADVLMYAQYYEAEKNNSRFSWIYALESRKDEIVAGDTTGDTMALLDPLFSPDGIAQALEGIKNKAAWIGVWFTGEDEWTYTLYREITGMTEAETSLGALGQGLEEYQNDLNFESWLYATIEMDLENLHYLDDGGAELKILEIERQAVAAEAMERYNNYVLEDYDRIVKTLNQSCDDYNTAIDEAGRLYQEMASARLQMRKRQEIQDWADSIYLKNFGANWEENYVTPKEKLSQIRYARERAQISVDVLTEILSGGAPRIDRDYSEAMEAYKESRRSYYLALAVAYEGSQAIVRQEAVVREAEAAEQAARANLLTEFDAFEPDPYELVALVKDGDGYRLELTYNVKNGGIVRDPEVLLDDAAFEEYFGAEHGETMMSLAEWEAAEWLRIIGAKGTGYFNDVMLASLYLRYCAAEGSEEGNKWFDGESDPRNNGNYDLGDIPLGNEFHGVDIGKEYNNARRNILAEAYQRIKRIAGGEEDIARYLLYRNRNLISGIAKNEEYLLKSRAIKEVERKLNFVYIAYFTGGIAAIAEGVVLTTAAIFFSPWLFVPAAAAYAIGGALLYAAAQVETVMGDMRNIQRGLNTITSGNDGKFLQEYTAWTNSLTSLENERAILSQMYRGTDTKSDNQEKGEVLSYENFSKALEYSLNAGKDSEKSAVSYDEAIQLYDRALYEKSGAEGGGTLLNTLNILNTALEKESAAKMEILNGEAARLKGEQESSFVPYYEWMSNALVIPADQQKKLRALALNAGDPSLSVAERQEAAREYEKLAAELYNDTEAARQEAEILLANALGNDTWNSEWHAANIIALEEELFGTLVRYTRPVESYTEIEGQLLRGSILAALDASILLDLSVKDRVWNLQWMDFLTQYNSWQEQAEQIRRTGLSEWEKARSKLNEGYYGWRKNFS